ncbi:hypothetical protein QCA50_003118 [Cerrena zonata]|uniref:Uncharacterized protein n=1 Tax=Cerrena zonata TaxID=2478898 RepID=A0AAW0GVK5_9APHY
MANLAAERFFADRASPLCSLDVAKSFAQLSTKEKKYAHYIGQASWAGARIIQGQWTPFALRLYDLLILVFSEKGKLGDLAALKQKSGVTADEWEDILQYTSQVLSNLVNYKSFGFSKFVPRAPEAAFAAVVQNSVNAANALPLWNELKGHIYQTTPDDANFIGKRSLGHVSNYYLGEAPTDEEVTAVQAAAEKIGIDVLSTRVRKNSATDFTLLVASANAQSSSSHEFTVGDKKAKAYCRVWRLRRRTIKSCDCFERGKEIRRK